MSVHSAPDEITPAQYDPYYAPYIALVTETDVIEAQENQIAEFRRVLDTISESDSEVPHDPYTWTIKQVVDHLINNEKIFGYRALRFAVGDPVPLPGYDQDSYGANANLNHCSMPALTTELELIRRSNLLMFRRLHPAAWDRTGTADGNRISVRAIAFLQIGHMRHHLEIVKRRLGRC